MDLFKKRILTWYNSIVYRWRSSGNADPVFHRWRNSQLLRILNPSTIEAMLTKDKLNMYFWKQLTGMELVTHRECAGRECWATCACDGVQQLNKSYVRTRCDSDLDYGLSHAHLIACLDITE